MSVQCCRICGEPAPEELEKVERHDGLNRRPSRDSAAGTRRPSARGPMAGRGRLRGPGLRPGLADRLTDVARTRCQQDRKSTRLNSSHVAISYAVFCLKKIQ